MDPAAKRVQRALLAPSPPGPYRDMTIAELTHSFQALSAQAALDVAWMSTVEEAVTDHAERLDVYSNLFAKTNTRFEEQEVELKAAATQVDHDLREHVKAQDAHSQHRLDALETKLSQTLDELDVELREHTKAAIKNLAD